MSLLDKASLIQIPSGYKNGKLYSVKPTPTYGSELVTNGDFATDSDWNKGANWTISGGTANRTANATSNISQVISGISGKKIQVVFTISNYGGSGGIGASANGNDYTQNSGNGTFTEQITPTSDNLYIRASYAFVGSIDNVSVKEITKIGDLDFSRSSSGTRVNSYGLIETAQVVSTTELVTNGDFASSSNWNGVNANGVTISNGTLNYSETPNGTNITQSSVVEIGKRYKVTFTISNYVKGGILVVLGAGGTTQEVSSNGTFNLYGVASINTTLYLQARGASGTTLSIDNVSVKEVIENDVPRLDYSGSCASLLLEPQSTNLIPNSNQYAGNTIYYTVTSNQSSPDGQNNATLFVEKTSTNSYSVTSVNASAIGGQTYSYSFFVKYAGKRNIPVNATDGVSGYLANIDILNGVVNSGNAEIKDFGNGWYRVLMTRTIAASANRATIVLNFGNITGDGTSGFYLFGFQVEQLPYATSYVPTSGSTVTRTADVCNNAGTAATFNSTEGVLFAEISALANGGSYRLMSVSDGTNNNRVTLGFSNTSNKFYFQLKANNSSIWQELITENVINTNKIAFKYKSGQQSVFVNGFEVINKTNSFTFSSNLNGLSFFEQGTTNPFYGKCKQLMVFDEALSDSELQALTTL